MPIRSFKHKAEELFGIIKGASGVFRIPEMEQFMSSIYCLSLKAKSIDKTDITVVLHDLRTGLLSERGFSIKSKLGSPSTLFNANGDNTSFIYQIEGVDQKHLEAVNSIKFFQAKFAYLETIGASVKFEKLANRIIQNNLMYVDYCLPEILGEVVLLYYCSGFTKLSDLTSFVSDSNPLNFDVDFKQNFYEHKIKRFLTDVALGLKPGKPWRGIYEATGGYIIVKEDGELLCYHIYDKNQFEDYLFNNTRLDTPSTTRHAFGDIYERDGANYIKLNLQIRFL